MLREVGNLLQRLLRRTDVASRYGGEEFLLLHPQSDGKGALQMAERIRAAVEAAKFDTSGAPLKVTMSLGVAEYDRHMSSPKDLVAAADRALYEAKRAGGNQIRVAA